MLSFCIISSLNFKSTASSTGSGATLRRSNSGSTIIDDQTGGAYGPGGIFEIGGIFDTSVKRAGDYVIEWLEQCREDAEEEGRKVRADASGTVHMFNDAKIYLAYPELVEALAEAAKNEGGEVEPRKGEDIVVELPVPMELHNWIYCRDIRLQLKPLPHLAAKRRPLNLIGKVCPFEDEDKSVRALFSLDGAAVKRLEELKKFYGSVGSYQLSPINVVRSHLLKVERELFRDVHEVCKFNFKLFSVNSKNI